MDNTTRNWVLSNTINKWIIFSLGFIIFCYILYEALPGMLDEINPSEPIPAEFKDTLPSKLSMIISDILMILIILVPYIIGGFYANRIKYPLVMTIPILIIFGVTIFAIIESFLHPDALNFIAFITISMRAIMAMIAVWAVYSIIMYFASKK